MVVAAQPIDTRPARFMTWFALVIVLATDAAYLSLVRGQTNGVDGQVLDAFTLPFVAGYVLAMAVLLAASLVRWWSAGVRMPLRAAGAGGLLVLGVIAIFSIGLPLVIAGAMATGATVRTLRGPQLAKSSLSAVAAAVVVGVVLVAGFEVTERMIVCPVHGSMSRGGSGFITGPYYYDCVNGQLSFHSGQCGNGSMDSNGNVSHSGC